MSCFIGQPWLQQHGGMLVPCPRRRLFRHFSTGSCPSKGSLLSCLQMLHLSSQQAGHKRDHHVVWTQTPSPIGPMGLSPNGSLELRVRQNRQCALTAANVGEIQCELCNFFYVHEMGLQPVRDAICDEVCHSARHVDGETCRNSKRWILDKTQDSHEPAS